MPVRSLLTPIDPEQQAGLCWIKGENPLDGENLPAPSDIVDELQAALGSFASVAAAVERERVRGCAGLHSPPHHQQSVLAAPHVSTTR